MSNMTQSKSPLHSALGSTCGSLVEHCLIDRSRSFARSGFQSPTDMPSDFVREGRSISQPRRHQHLVLCRPRSTCGSVVDHYLAGLLETTNLLGHELAAFCRAHFDSITVYELSMRSLVMYSSSYRNDPCSM